MPRVVRGSERLTARLSELTGLLLAGQKRLFDQHALFYPPHFWWGRGFELTNRQGSRLIPLIRRSSPYAPGPKMTHTDVSGV